MYLIYLKYQIYLTYLTYLIYVTYSMYLMYLMYAGWVVVNGNYGLIGAYFFQMEYTRSDRIEDGYIIVITIINSIKILNINCAVILSGKIGYLLSCVIVYIVGVSAFSIY